MVILLFVPGKPHRTIHVLRAQHTVHPNIDMSWSSPTTIIACGLKKPHRDRYDAIMTARMVSPAAS